MLCFKFKEVINCYGLRGTTFRRGFGKKKQTRSFFVKVIKKNTVTEIEQNDNFQVAKDFFANRKKIIAALKKKNFVYCRRKSAWFLFDGKKYQSKKTVENITLVENTLLAIGHTFNNKPLNSEGTWGMATKELERLTGDLVLPEKKRFFEAGINFVNGFYIFCTNELVKHSPKRFVTDCKEHFYVLDQPLSDNWKNYLLAISDSDPRSIFLIRSLLYCSIVKDVRRQIGFYLWGKKGTGKSMLLRLIKAVLENRCVTMTPKNLESNFNRVSIYGKHLIICHEILKMGQSLETNIKMLLGRDSMKAELKHENVQFEEIFQGLLVLTSNHCPENIIGHSEPLLDRLIPIKFSKSAETNPLFSNFMFDLLSADLNGLINWIRSFPTHTLPHFTRVSQLNVFLGVKQPLLLRFVCENLVYSPNSSISLEAVRDLYQDFGEKENLKISISLDEFAVRVADLIGEEYSHINIRKIKPGPRAGIPGRPYHLKNLAFVNSPELKEHTPFLLPKPPDTAFDHSDFIKLSGLDASDYEKKSSKS